MSRRWGPTSGLVAFKRTATMAARGTNSWSSPSRFVSKAGDIVFTPVMLPPGRLKLATRPDLMGSSPTLKTMGMVDVAAFAACAEMVPPVAAITATWLPNQVGCKGLKFLVVAPRPAVFNADVLAFDVTCLFQAFVECRH